MAEEEVVAVGFGGYAETEIEEADERVEIVGAETAADQDGAGGIVGDEELAGIVAVKLRGHVAQRAIDEIEPHPLPGESVFELGGRDGAKLHAGGGRQRCVRAHESLLACGDAGELPADALRIIGRGVGELYVAFGDEYGDGLGLSLHRERGADRADRELVGGDDERPRCIPGDEEVRFAAHELDPARVAAELDAHFRAGVEFDAGAVFEREVAWSGLDEGRRGAVVGRERHPPRRGAEDESGSGGEEPTRQPAGGGRGVGEQVGMGCDIGRGRVIAQAVEPRPRVFEPRNFRAVCRVFPEPLQIGILLLAGEPAVAAGEPLRGGGLAGGVGFAGRHAIQGMQRRR